MATAAWRALLEDLERRRAAAAEMGGPERLARLRDAGRLDARVRDGRRQAGDGRGRGLHSATWDDVVHPAELRDTLLRHLALTGPRRRGRPEPVVRTGYLP